MTGVLLRVFAKAVGWRHSFAVAMGFACGVSGILLSALMLDAYAAYTARSILVLEPHVRIMLRPGEGPTASAIARQALELRGVRAANPAAVVSLSVSCAGIISREPFHPREADIVLKALPVIDFGTRVTETAGDRAEEAWKAFDTALTNLSLLRRRGFDFSLYYDDQREDIAQIMVGLAQAVRKRRLTDLEKRRSILEIALPQDWGSDLEAQVEDGTNLASLSTEGRVLLTRELATELFWFPLRSGDPLVLRLQQARRAGGELVPVDATTSRVVETAGLVDLKATGGTHYLITSLSRLPTWFPGVSTDDLVDRVEVRLIDPHDRETYEGLRQLFPGREVSFWEDRNRGALAVISVLDTTVLAVSILIYGVSGFGLYSMLRIVVRDRRRVLALMKALGARSGSVVLAISAFGAVVSTAGVLAGVAGSAVIAGWLQQSGLEGVREVLGDMNWRRLVSDGATSVKLLGAVLVGMAAAAGPARQAGQLSAAEGLREE